jgi:hypothetical protein
LPIRGAMSPIPQCHGSSSRVRRSPPPRSSRPGTGKIHVSSTPCRLYTGQKLSIGRVRRA